LLTKEGKSNSLTYFQKSPALSVVDDRSARSVSH